MAGRHASLHLLAWAFLAPLSPPSAYPCTYVTTQPPATSGPDFTVTVTSRDAKPVAGLRLHLNDGWRREFHHAFTDANGVARFSGVEPGNYSLAALNGGMGDAIAVTITRPGPRGMMLKLIWPAQPPKVTSHLRGTAQRGYEPAVPPSQVKLLDAKSGRLLDARPAAKFDFGPRPAGLYFLDFGPGLLLVDLNPDSALNHLDLELSLTSCGVTFLNRHECPAFSLQVPTLTGQLADPAGASISGAPLQLTNAAGETTTQTSGPDGHFTWPPLPAGNYRLAMHSPGFHALTITVKIDPEAPAVARQFRLGILGACGSLN